MSRTMSCNFLAMTSHAMNRKRRNIRAPRFSFRKEVTEIQRLLAVWKTLVVSPTTRRERTCHSGKLSRSRRWPFSFSLTSPSSETTSCALWSTSPTLICKFTTACSVCCSCFRNLWISFRLPEITARVGPSSWLSLLASSVATHAGSSLSSIWMAFCALFAQSSSCCCESFV